MMKKNKTRLFLHEHTNKLMGTFEASFKDVKRVPYFLNMEKITKGDDLNISFYFIDFGRKEGRFYIDFPAPSPEEKNERTLHMLSLVEQAQVEDEGTEKRWNP